MPVFKKTGLLHIALEACAADKQKNNIGFGFESPIQRAWQ
jgi:hypothetical protein